VFDRNLFRATVLMRGMKLEGVASELGINPATLYRKINGITEFTRMEIQLLRHTLKLSPGEADAIFFAKELADTQVSSVSPTGAEET
jgi:hypothetical protein